jgi:hypothetical protein
MSKLRVFCLPTIKNRIVFHAEYPSVDSKIELGALFAGYVLRKWRYQISDTFGSYWHQLGRKQSYFQTLIYNFGNRLTTRRCADEYFFKQIVPKTLEIEFIFPTCLDESLIQKQLSTWIGDSRKFSPKLLFFGLLLPTNFYIAKWFLIGAQAGFSYHVFRLNAVARAHFGSQKIQKLANRRRVTWTSSPKLQAKIEEFANQVRDENQAEGLKTSWAWKSGEDLHDDVVSKLEKEFKLPELLHTFRRTRLQYYVHPDS